MRPRALVTGGSAGLGAAFVADLLAQGFDVVSIDRDPPRETIPNVHAIRANLGDIASLPGLIAMLDDNAPYEVVVLNAGISAVGAFEDIGIDHLERLIAINLIAPIELTRLLLASGRVSNRASLIFIGSLSNRLGYPGASVYAATKQGIEAFATALRKTGKHAVLCVLPGPLDTEHASRYAPKGSKGGGRQTPASLAERVLVRRHRSGTVYGTPAYGLAGLAGWLAPSFMTRLMRRGMFGALRAAPPVVDARPGDPGV